MVMSCADESALVWQRWRSSLGLHAISVLISVPTGRGVGSARSLPRNSAWSSHVRIRPVRPTKFPTRCRPSSATDLRIAS